MSSQRSTKSDKSTNGMNYEPITCRELGLLLKKLGYSHREFAEFIDRSRSYVSSVINGAGEPPYRLIEWIQLMITTPWYNVALQAVREEERIRTENEERRRMEWAEEQRLEEEERQRRAEKRRARTQNYKENAQVGVK